jgi:cAMP-dependent protein kinase regulator
MQVVAEYTEGMSFGELALLYNSPRAATVTCYHGGKEEKGMAELWALERKRFRHVMINTGASALNSKAELFLKSVKILSSLDDSQRAKVTASTKRRALALAQRTATCAQCGKLPSVRSLLITWIPCTSTIPSTW